MKRPSHFIFFLTREMGIIIIRYNETFTQVCNFELCDIYCNHFLSVSGRGAERERETQNLKQAPGSELSAQSLDVGLKLMSREIVT